jgi:hypothetical protein
LHTTSSGVAQPEELTAEASAWKFWLTSLASAGVPCVNVFGIETWACAELAALTRRTRSRSEVRSLIGESFGVQREWSRCPNIIGGFLI